MINPYGQEGRQQPMADGSGGNDDDDDIAITNCDGDGAVDLDFGASHRRRSCWGEYISQIHDLWVMWNEEAALRRGGGGGNHGQVAMVSIMMMMLLCACACACVFWLFVFCAWNSNSSSLHNIILVPARGYFTWQHMNSFRHITVSFLISPMS
jgi:hypothetical protein